jgi:hypothetical protein
MNKSISVLTIENITHETSKAVQDFLDIKDDLMVELRDRESIYYDIAVTTQMTRELLSLLSKREETDALVTYTENSGDANIEMYRFDDRRNMWYNLSGYRETIWEPGWTRVKIK